VKPAALDFSSFRGSPRWRVTYDQRRVAGRQARDARATQVRCEQKSSWLSRCVRFVIARHSPERVLERGLPMEAPEKNRCNRSEPAQGQIFSGPVGGGNTAKSRPFSRISREMQQNFSAVETAWRREQDSNSGYPFGFRPKVPCVSDLQGSPAGNEHTGETN